MTASVLFACNLNSVRSPIAAELLRRRAGDAIAVDSAGVYEGWLDPFVEAVMAEIGASLQDHEPKTMKSVDLASYDTVIALTEEAASEARKIIADDKVEFWAIPNPSTGRREREEVLEAYRTVRDTLAERITSRFPGV